MERRQIPSPSFLLSLQIINYLYLLQIGPAQGGSIETGQPGVRRLDWDRTTRGVSEARLRPRYPSPTDLLRTTKPSGQFGPAKEGSIETDQLDAKMARLRTESMRGTLGSMRPKPPRQQFSYTERSASLLTDFSHLKASHPPRHLVEGRHAPCTVCTPSR